MEKSETIHKKNLQILMTEVYRTINHLNPEYMWEFFTKRDVPYGLRSSELCTIPSVNPQRYGINSLSFRGSLLWNALSDEIKLTTSAKKFKKGNTTLGWQKLYVPHLHIASFFYWFSIFFLILFFYVY